MFILLLAAGFLAVILPKERYSRFVSVLLFAVGGLLLFNFYENWQLGGTHASVYRVLEYKQLYLDIDLSSSPALYALIFPFFSMEFCLGAITVSHHFSAEYQIFSNSFPISSGVKL